jgi:hypothetical protein
MVLKDETQSIFGRLNEAFPCPAEVWGGRGGKRPLDVLGAEFFCNDGLIQAFKTGLKFLFTGCQIGSIIRVYYIGPNPST